MQVFRLLARETGERWLWRGMRGIEQKRRHQLDSSLFSFRGWLGGCQGRRGHLSTYAIERDSDTSSSDLERAGLRVLFFGTDARSVVALKGLHACMSSQDGIVNRLEVVCPPDQPGKRNRTKLLPCAVMEYAKMHGLVTHPVTPPEAQQGRKSDFLMQGFQFPYSAASPLGATEETRLGGTASLLGAHFDVGVVVSFGYKLPEWVVELFPYGMINLHPSLLPKYTLALNKDK